MNTSPKYNIPWELIVESLTGNLPVEGEHQLQQWLLSAPGNKEKYKQIQELWKNRIEDYKFYKTTDEKQAWKALHDKLGKVNPGNGETKIIEGSFTRKRRLFRNLVAVAAVFLGLIGIWFILKENKPLVYETAINVQKKVTLDDGSIVTLGPLTKIEIPGDYKVNRTIVMASGEASFDVVHEADKPFIVKLGPTQVKDIGTSFTIQKGEKEINVSVTSGKVAFIKSANNETRELSAGAGITFDLERESFGEIKPVKIPGNSARPLNFHDTSLQEAITTIQNIYGKKIIINDPGIINKKITAQLDGMPFNTVMKVICKSLGLEYSMNDSVYILKERIGEQP